MATISVTVPNTGPVVTVVSAAAQAKYLADWNATHTDGSTPPVLTNVQAVTYLVREYLKAVYRQNAVNAVATTAQADIAAADTQAVTDAAVAIT